ncbi:DUF2634 domain-containing protein [Fructilactobacillus vespulae]|uniref:DUF2634 domain-containing protein n=1 Tax=Fructilactobacillus vespulae TaxID=1249630 RepID=UPI0039B61807
MNNEEMQQVVLPTKTYEVSNGRIVSTVDGIEAMSQCIQKALMTARFSVPWLSPNYGTDIYNLIGKSLDYAKMEVERMLKETFISDKRITEVKITSLETFEKNTLIVKADIKTIFGNLSIEKEVKSDVA